MPRLATPASPFRYFNSSPEVIRLAAMMYLRSPHIVPPTRAGNSQVQADEVTSEVRLSARQHA